MISNLPHRFIINKRIFSFSSSSELINRIENFNGALIAVGAEKLLNDDKELTSLINENIAYCDGYGAVLALKRAGLVSAKIPGAQLWLEILKAYENEKSVYLIGASQDVIEATFKKLRKDFPLLNILGHRNGFFKNDSDVIDEIKKLKPGMVFVAMGSPKQEYFIKKLMNYHKALYMGLGGSFDLYTGNASKVPNWWNKFFKWEGLYRLFNDILNINRIKRQKIIFRYTYYLLTKKF
ncbi:MAG: WecB/TagA/CpsF family glycosyltransferase [Flavobacteriaceae bacterium]|nr:WecB/TagA/CpsF family glycosyltransferase [Flavobacteriaceae bacterium]